MHRPAVPDWSNRLTVPGTDDWCGSSGGPFDRKSRGGEDGGKDDHSFSSHPSRTLQGLFQRSLPYYQSLHPWILSTLLTSHGKRLYNLRTRAAVVDIC